MNEGNDSEYNLTTNRIRREKRMNTFWFVLLERLNKDWVEFFIPLVDWLIISNNPTVGLISRPAAPFKEPYRITKHDY